MCSARASFPRRRTKPEAGCLLLSRLWRRDSDSLGQGIDHGEVNRYEINFKGNREKIQWQTGYRYEGK